MNDRNRPSEWLIRPFISYSFVPHSPGDTSPSFFSLPDWPKGTRGRDRMTRDVNGGNERPVRETDERGIWPFLRPMYGGLVNEVSMGMASTWPFNPFLLPTFLVFHEPIERPSIYSAYWLGDYE